MTIHVGDRIPEVTLKRIREGIETLDTHSLFDARKVVLFAVPGAFTPTCSARHLPGYVESSRPSASAASTSTAWRSTTRS
jgi:peroxiredoxin